MIESLPARAAAGRAQIDAGGWARSAAHAAVLTAALSLPQGLLALPVAVAQAGLGRGLLVLLAVGALNAASVAWTARLTAAAYARRGAAPSLTALAAEHLGARGGLLATAGGGALFFLALIASLVGLARSLAELAGAPAWAWGAACGLALLAVAGGGASLSTRLLCWLGLLNLGLLAALLLLVLAHGQAAPAPRPAGGDPLAAVGVSLMLFFAPMLTAPVARQVLPRGGGPGALAWGCAAGVALSAGLFALWAVGAARVASGPALAAAGGTALPLVLAAVPAGRAPATLLGLLLLGMTALRCALVLRALAEEQLARRARGGRGALAQAPAGLGLLIAVGLLLAGVGSFTQLIALAGACAASVVSLVVPGLLALARPRRAGRPAAGARRLPVAVRQPGEVQRPAPHDREHRAEVDPREQGQGQLPDGRARRLGRSQGEGEHGEPVDARLDEEDTAAQPEAVAPGARGHALAHRREHHDRHADPEQAQEAAERERPGLRRAVREGQAHDPAEQGAQPDAEALKPPRDL